MDTQLLLVDIDNVIAHTDEVMREVIREFSREGVDLKYKDVKHFDYWKCVDDSGRRLHREEWKSVHHKFSEECYIGKIRPYDNISEHLSALSEVGFDVHLVTSRLEAARVPTVQWLERHNIPHVGLHFVKHRSKHLLFRHHAVVVEDDLEQAVLFADLGCQTHLLAHPWNETDESSSVVRVRSWQDLAHRLTNQTASCMEVSPS